MNGVADSAPAKSGAMSANGVRCYRYEVLKGPEVPQDVNVAEKEVL